MRTPHFILGILFFLFLAVSIVIFRVSPLSLFSGNHGQASLPLLSSELAAPLEKGLEEITPREEKLSYEDQLKRGTAYIEEGRFKDAAFAYTTASGMKEFPKEAYYGLGKLAALQGDYDTAFSHYQLILRKEPRDVRTLLAVAHGNMEKGQMGPAKTLLEGLDPLLPEVRLLKGILFAYEGDKERALTELTPLLDQGISEGIRIPAQRFVDAYKEFELFRDGKSVHMRLLVAKALTDNGDHRIALGLLKELLKQKYDYVDGWVLLGYNSYVIGDFPAALTAFQGAYALQKDRADVLFYLGITTRALGKTDQSVDYFLQALEHQYVDTLELRRRLAEVYVEREAYKEAAEQYELLLKEHPRSVTPESYVRPIWLYIDHLNDAPSALRLAESASTQFPEEALTMNLLGWAYYGVKEYDKAEEQLIKALQKDRALAPAYVNLGRVYAARGDKELAKQFYKKAYNMGRDTSVGNLAADLYNDLLDDSTTHLE